MATGESIESGSDAESEEDRGRSRAHLVERNRLLRQRAEEQAARIEHGDHEEFEEIVDAVVYPEELAANAASNEIIDVGGGGVRTIEEVTDRLELIEIKVAERAPAAGKSLQAVSFPRGAVVVAEQRTGAFPGPDMVLEPGVQYILAVQTDVTDEVVRLLRG